MPSLSNRSVIVGDRFQAIQGGAIWRIVRMLEGGGREFAHAYLSREGGVKTIMLLSTRALTGPDQENWMQVREA